MATLSTRSGNKRVIQFTDADKRRRTLYLGKVPIKAAKTIQSHVEALVHARLTGTSPPPNTSAWLGEAGDSLHEKLVKLGLADPRQKSDPTELGPFLKSYIASRTDLKPLTIRHLNDARRNLVAFFGEGKPLADITPGDADEFRRGLLSRLGDNTVRRQCGRAKQFFRFAARKRLIDENPFADMKDCTVRANRSREHFVTHEQIERVIEGTPDHEWKLIIALARYGGLRTPSETVSLTWDCVLWDQGKLRVPSPKTAHHDGHDERFIPLFPQLLPHLEAAFDAAPEGAEYVIRRYRNGQNLVPQFRRLIRRSGQECWPKAFQNLRSSRQTELEQEYPSYVTCRWLGNSETISRRHYLQVLPEHFTRACTVVAECAADSSRNAAHCSAGSVQAKAETPGNQRFSRVSGYTKLPPQGLEP